jgi:hypothetical protein
MSPDVSTATGCNCPTACAASDQLVSITGNIFVSESAAANDEDSPDDTTKIGPCCDMSNLGPNAID